MHNVMFAVQIFDDKGHSSLLTSQMTPQWRSIRRAVATSLSPQSLRYSKQLLSAQVLALPALETDS